jgi:hypothetical protein
MMYKACSTHWGDKKNHTFCWKTRKNEASWDSVPKNVGECTKMDLKKNGCTGLKWLVTRPVQGCVGHGNGRSIFATGEEYDQLSD